VIDATGVESPTLNASTAIGRQFEERARADARRKIILVERAQRDREDALAHGERRFGHLDERAGLDVDDVGRIEVAGDVDDVPVGVHVALGEYRHGPSGGKDARGKMARTGSVTLVLPLHKGSLAMTDRDAASHPLTFDAGAVETTGLALHEHADGTMRITAQRCALRQLDLRAEARAVDIASMVVTGLAARFTRMKENEPARLLEASAEEVRVEGMNGFVDAVPTRAAGQGDGLRLEALAGLDGLVRAFVTDALWIIDAEIVVPLAQGVIDFNRVIVEHIGPNSSMSVGPRSIHIDAPHRARIDLVAFGGNGVPGASLEAAGPSRSRRDRGRLHVAPFLQGMLGALPDERRASLAAGLEGPLLGTRLAGDLQLGDGALGTAAHHMVLTGRAAGKNRIEVASAALGERIVVRVPAFAASAATLAIGGATLETGTLSAVVELHLITKDGQGESGKSRALALAVRAATLHAVRLT
jgi:hypothetical protein